MKKLLTLAVLLVAALMPATASAKPLPDVISIYADDKFIANELFGSVESKKSKCERNRRVRLFYNPGKSDFDRVFQTKTDNAGGYEIFAGDIGEGIFPSGFYFTRVLRAERGNDVCRRDDSRVIEIEDL
jgi:hypothetical protein